MLYGPYYWTIQDLETVGRESDGDGRLHTDSEKYGTCLYQMSSRVTDCMLSCFVHQRHLHHH